MTDTTGAAGLRPVYMILSPRSLGYARLCLETLLRNSADGLFLRLLTDSAEDADALRAVMEEIAPDARHRWQVLAEADLLEREEERFGRFPRLRAFRHGHPCWRKITDPLLLTEPGAEMILLDPDLYFPNRFRFEPTVTSGVQLMWQQPNCLLPAEVVRRAMNAGVALARHVDIGVAQWRFPDGGDLLEWMDGLIGTLGGAELPRMMHVEAIVWAALAMRYGGGHLNPAQWVCWRRSQMKRVRRKLGATSRAILRTEPWTTLKCFHGGGEAKWWIPEMVEEIGAGVDLAEAAPAALLPFVPLTETRFKCEQGVKALARQMGYYRVLGAS